MNALERTLTTLGHQEPDRVPLFLLLSLYGARELNMPIKEYFSDAQTVFEGQKQMLQNYGADCLYTLQYAAAEYEAFGGGTRFISNGPPNSDVPIVQSPKDIENLRFSSPEAVPSLNRVLQTTALLKEEYGDNYPIVGVCISPFSMPVMQMGFDRYLDLMHREPALFWTLIRTNQEFAVAWSNAQLKAGATAICYFDPVSSPTIITKNQYLETGKKIAKETIARINGPTVTHFASGRVSSVVDDLSETGTLALAASSLEDIGALKQKCKGKIAVFGNLNAIEMIRWTPQEIEKNVRKIIQKAAPGGGFILSDNHGEIPYQMPPENLKILKNVVDEFGSYPLKTQPEDEG